MVSSPQKGSQAWATRQKVRDMRIRAFALISMLTLLAMSPSACLGKDPCLKKNLPDAVKKLLEKEYPEWRLKKVEDLQGYDREVWLRVNPGLCPGIAGGRFELDSATSYALLLIPEETPETGYRLVVARKSPGRGYELRVLDEHTDWNSRSIVVKRVPAGEYSNAQDETKIQLKLDAVLLERLEAWTVLYYYGHDEYRRMVLTE